MKILLLVCVLSGMIDNTCDFVHEIEFDTMDECYEAFQNVDKSIMTAIACIEVDEDELR